MNKFLDELSKMLRGNVPDSYVKSNLDYYREYINEEKAKGRKESDILLQLGDPRLIAKNIINTSPIQNKNSNRAYYEECDINSKENDYSNYDKENKQYHGEYCGSEKNIGFMNKMYNNKAGKVIVALCGFIIAAFVIWLVISLIGLILAILLPIIGVIVLIKMLVRIFTRK